MSVARAELTEDELTLHLVASGLLDWMKRLDQWPIVSAPYPATLQHSLDRFAVACLRRHQNPPDSVMGLLGWCRRPLIDWPLDLADHQFSAPDCLLEGTLPTPLCEAWACASADVEAELTEQRLMLHVMDTCRASNAPNSYIAFRELLIRRPVLTALEFQQVVNDPQFEMLADAVQTAYMAAPLSATVNGYIHCCPTCNNILLPTIKGELICENLRCRIRPRHSGGRRIQMREGVYWLKRGVRYFVTKPGLVELHLADDLQQMGVQVELWPDYDRYDLRLIFADNEIWAVDVKDWVDPNLLGRRIKPIPRVPSWEKAYFVFPDERKKERGDYARAFERAARQRNMVVKGVFRRELLRRTRQKLKEIA